MKSTVVEPSLLTADQTQAKLGISRRKVFELIATGDLESVKIGRSRRVIAAGIDRYIQRLALAQADALEARDAG